MNRPVSTGWLIAKSIPRGPPPDERQPREEVREAIHRYLGPPDRLGSREGYRFPLARELAEKEPPLRGVLHATL